MHDRTGAAEVTGKGSPDLNGKKRNPEQHISRFPPSPCIITALSYIQPWKHLPQTHPNVLSTLPSIAMGRAGRAHESRTRVEADLVHSPTPAIPQLSNSIPNHAPILDNGGQLYQSCDATIPAGVAIGAASQTKDKPALQLGIVEQCV